MPKKVTKSKQTIKNQSHPQLSSCCREHVKSIFRNPPPSPSRCSQCGKKIIYDISPEKTWYHGDQFEKIFEETGDNLLQRPRYSE